MEDRINDFSGPEIFQIKLGLNSCYIIGSKDFVMVDGGVPGKLGSFKKKLARFGIDPEAIKLIVLTHSHFDHSGSANDIRDLTGAKIAIHKSEKTFLEDGGIIVPKGTTINGRITQPLLFPLFKRISFPKFSPDILIDEEPYSLDSYGINGYIIHTPGHTMGSISVVLDSGEAFVGCLAHDGFPFRFRPGIPIYAQDIDQVKKSWRLLSDRGVRMVYPGHGNPFPFDRIKNAVLV